MRKKFSNQEILNIAILLADNFVNEDKGEIELPIRINFYLQKNIPQHRQSNIRRVLRYPTGFCVELRTKIPVVK